VLPITAEIAQEWGRLGPVGQSPPAIDGLMVATALVHHLTLVTRNVADVDRTGVPVVNPFQPEQRPPSAGMLPPTPPAAAAPRPQAWAGAGLGGRVRPTAAYAICAAGLPGLHATFGNTRTIAACRCGRSLVKMRKLRHSTGCGWSAYGPG